tara:strand:- start:228 stop:848 length:621 start_codon:yes stop_codon:yes gene_type:complete
MAMIIPPRKPIQNQTEDLLNYGQTVNQQTDGMFHTQTLLNDVDKLYNSFVDAETGHLEGINKFIRTEASKTPGGSSAYGPAQMTGTLVRDMLERKIVPDHLKEYANKFLDQSEKFLKYGNEKYLTGYDPKYDYGGEGDLTSEKDQENYKELAKSILAHHWKNAQGEDSINTIIRAWRFGPSSEKGETDDPNYWDRFKESYSKAAID